MKLDDKMIKTRRMDWEREFKAQPDRYMQVYDEETGELIEVHDKDTGNVFFKVNGNEWMAIN